MPGLLNLNILPTLLVKNPYNFDRVKLGCYILYLTEQALVYHPLYMTITFLKFCILCVHGLDFVNELSMFLFVPGNLIKKFWYA